MLWRLRKVADEPRADAVSTRCSAEGLVGSAGLLDLSLPVFLEHPKPFFTEHDLPLSPFRDHLLLTS
jgi:hypothetical protein